jgi:hypothetical protein
MKSIKGRTAREANLLLGRTGRRFWQEEAYDHGIRNKEEFEKEGLYPEESRDGGVCEAGGRWGVVQCCREACGRAPRLKSRPQVLAEED